MNDKEPPTRLSDARNTVPNDADKTLVSPHFDDAALRLARPAVPISAVRPWRSWPLALTLLAVVAGLAGGVAGGLLATGFRRDTNQTAARTDADRVAVETNDSADGDAPAQTSIEPIAGPQQQPSTAGQPVQEDQYGHSAPTSEPVGNESDADQPATGAAADEPVATLREALNGWIDATNSRDIGRQMSFYDQRVESFYRARNVTVADVRSEKARVFEKARSIMVGAGAPKINIGPDGRTAVMRFHKRYDIAGGGEDRRGEVVQELRWRLVGGQWKITSERDILVVR